MTLARSGAERALRCDPCGRMFYVCVVAENPAALGRRARAAGWTRRMDGKHGMAVDRCPDCSATAPALKTPPSAGGDTQCLT